MKVAVITPYHDPDSPFLEQCLSSVQRQTHGDLFHVTIGDGCSLRPAHKTADIHDIALPRRLKNYGDSPRSIGVVYAFSLGADAVTFLDSDNWYADDHVELMVRKQASTGCDVITSRRYITHLDGTVMGTCPESDGVLFCDTNCVLVTRNLAEEAGLWWLIPDDMHVIDDRVMWDTLIHASDKIASTGRVSVYYRTAFEFHYRMFGLPPPAQAKSGSAIGDLGSVIGALQERAKQKAKARHGGASGGAAG